LAYKKYSKREKTSRAKAQVYGLRLGGCSHKDCWVKLCGFRRIFPLELIAECRNASVCSRYRFL